MINALWERFFLRRPETVRRELRFVDYSTADKMMQEHPGVWTIAPEEDSNKELGWVYIERRVRTV